MRTSGRGSSAPPLRCGVVASSGVQRSPGTVSSSVRTSKRRSLTPREICGSPMNSMSPSLYRCATRLEAEPLPDEPAAEIDLAAGVEMDGRPRVVREVVRRDEEDTAIVRCDARLAVPDDLRVASGVH